MHGTRRRLLPASLNARVLLGSPSVNMAAHLWSGLRKTSSFPVAPSSPRSLICASFFFNDTATTEIYTLSLHDALPISPPRQVPHGALIEEFDERVDVGRVERLVGAAHDRRVLIRSHLLLPVSLVPVRCGLGRSEEHTSELQSHLNLVCRLLLEKKKTKY